MRNVPISNQFMNELYARSVRYRAAEVVWAVREEMARTAADVLARRTRALYLNAKAAIEMAPRVVALVAQELGRDADWVAEQGFGGEGSRVGE